MARWLFNIVIGIYNSVGKVYDMLLSFVDNTNVTIVRESFSDLVDNVYVLCGLFMLFRLTVSFLNMLIDPDKANDKQVGAGAIIKRVFVSLILIILFQPNSIILNPDTGLLARVERAVLTGDNSLLDNIMPETTSESSKTKRNLSIMFEDVYAANNVDDINCLYQILEKSIIWGDTGNAGVGNTITNGQTAVTSYVPKGKYYITFTKNESGTKHIEPLSGSSSKSTWNLKITKKGSIKGVRYDNSDLLDNVASYKMKISTIQTNYLDKGICPPSFMFDEECQGFLCNNGSITVVRFKNTKKLNEDIYAQVFSNIETEKDILDEESEMISSRLDDYDAEIFTEEKIEEMVGQDSSLNSSQASQVSENVTNSTLEMSEKSINFVRPLFLSFVDQLDDSEETDATLDKIFTSQAANTDVWKLMKSDSNPKAEMDVLLAIIAGIIIIIYLFMLCVDIVVRQFKLILLEVMAPIPIISYIDPKDKVFDEWKKIFISVYVDLFIKILVINIGIRSINLLWGTYSDEPNSFFRIMVLMGIFVFVKGLPNLISKIFGIDASATSFKEIGSVMKRGAGMAIGGVIGAGAALGSAGFAVGAAVGNRQGFGNVALAGLSALKNVASGALRGIGGGYSGNVKGGISAAQLNMRNRQAYSQGVTASALAGSAILGGIGMDYASRQDRKVADLQEQVKAYDELGKTKDTMKDIWKSSDLYSNMMGMKDENGNNLFGQEEIDAARDLWMMQQFNGNTNNWRKKNGEDLDYNSDDYQFRSRIIGKFADRGLSFKTETSKKAQLEDAVRDANAKKRGSSTLSTTFGDKEFENWEDVVTMEKTTTAKKRELQGKINESTIADQRYNQSVAAREINKNNQ